MNSKQNTYLSKFLSLVLRHQPQTIGITLDSAGWVGIDELLERCNAHGTRISLAELHDVVATSEKKRFALSDDGKRIRASQGHSVAVELGYAPTEPPEVLYHGTVSQFLASIYKNGLTKGKRHDVHLSESTGTAQTVGARRGKPIILRIRSGQMHRDGLAFRLSENHVWLTDHVPPQYIERQGEDV